MQGQSRKSYLETYRNDFAWYYARGLQDNGVNPILYIPSTHETGKHETNIGVDVRFLRLNCFYCLLNFSGRSGSCDDHDGHCTWMNN